MWLPLLCFLDVHGIQIIAGIAQELVDRMAARGAVTKHYPCVMHESYTIYDPEVFKIVAQELVLEAGVDVMLHTFVADVIADNGQIATQYADPAGLASMDPLWNANGSLAAIEGITSPDGRVLGKMGHSERIGTNVAMNVPGEKDQKLFEGGVAYFK